MPRDHQAVSAEQMREILREWCSRHGKLVAAAESLSVAPGSLSEMLSGQRSISDHVAAQLGFSKVRETKRIEVIYYIGGK